MTISNSNNSKDLALLDSNILIYAHQALSSYHDPCRDLRDKALDGQLAVCVTPQVLSEFYAVITNPRRVTNPVSAQEARVEVEKYILAQSIAKILPGRDFLTHLLELLRSYSVTRQEIFDLQLVATMLSNEVNRIYTYNREHFIIFKEIEVLTP